MKGKNNEDSFGVSAFSLGVFGARPVLLAVLCDGIGGHRAGEVAAEMAVERISREVGRSNAADPPEILRGAVVAANNAVYAASRNSPEKGGMGATCACAWIIGERLYTANVGDSRLYLLRRGSIRQLSTDHTWIQEALDAGMIQPEQVEGHPNQHVIRRYLGGPVPPDVDLRLRLKEGEDDQSAHANQGMQLLPGDLVLLTSDGLTDLVADKEIQAAFTREQAPDLSSEERLGSAADELIGLANARGGHDNITLVAIEVPRRAVLRQGIKVNRWAWAAGGCAGLLLILATLALLAGGLWKGQLQEWWRVNGPFPSATAEAGPPVDLTSEPQQPEGQSGAEVQATQPPQPGTAAGGTANPPAAFTTPTATPAELFAPESGSTLTPWPTNTP